MAKGRADAVGVRVGLAAWVLVALVAPALGQTGASASPTPGARRVRIAAAADLKFALDEIITRYKATQPGVDITVTYGSSGNFFQQLSNKAPYDLFLSADAEYPKKLVEAGQAVKGSEFLYARGRIVLWVRNDSTLDIERRGLNALLDPAVQKVAIANPRVAPYGRAAEAALKSAGIYDQVQDRLVLGENIAQTAQFAESGAADVGLIALSLAAAPAMKDKGRYSPVPAELHPPIEQGGAILAWAEDPAATRAFRDYLVGGGLSVLEHYGFDVPVKRKASPPARR
jgi:molybdate transport system substrate-binding protein